MSGAEKLLSFAPTLKREVVGAPVSLQACHMLYGIVFTHRGWLDARHGRSSAAVAAAPSNVGGGGSFNEDSSLEWVVFDDVEGMDRALGKVTYINVEGNERDYWLGWSSLCLLFLRSSITSPLLFLTLPLCTSTSYPSRFDLRRGIDDGNRTACP